VEIARVDVLRAYAGWRIHEFLKVTLRDGLVGWSEFSRAFGGPGLGEAIDALRPTLIGRDPRSADVHNTLLHAARRSSVTHQASGAVRNALLDARARALGIPVYELLGGALRERVPLYWAHCGTYRVSHAELMERPPVRRLDDLTALGREVVLRGYAALKTNLLLFDDEGARRYAPRGKDLLNASPRLVRALSDQLAALRAGTGPDVEIMVDLGSNVHANGALTMVRALARERPSPAWVEVELRSAAALRQLRDLTGVAVASGESLRQHEYHELLRAGAVDVMIVDVLFNGLQEAQHVAAACDAYDTPIAVHNCYSPLATLMNAAFCATVPNLRIMERDVDEVPWAESFLTQPPVIEDGCVRLPTGPGWGTEIDEAAIRAHPVEGTA
jgi:L-alanine-DL-glutamate epimerase-like enolase superfamily enzyme